MPTIQQLAALLHDTLRGVLRRPAVGLLLLAAVLLSGVLPTMDLLSFLTKRALVADAQVALIILTGVLAAGLAVASGLGDELRRGAPELLCRTTSPATLAWGRFLGLAVALSVLWLPLAVAALWGSRTAFDDYHEDAFAARLYFVLVWLAILLAGGASWRRSVSFPAAMAGWLAVLLPLGLGVLTFIPRAGLAGTQLIDWSLAPALLMALPALWLAASVAWFAGLRFDGSAVLAATLGIFVLGLAGPPLLAEAGLGWCGALLPSWQPFWVERGANVAWPAIAAGGLQAAALVMLTAAGLAKRSGR